MSEPDRIRVSDAERETVADQLRQSAAEGRLDPDELGDRVQSALSARTRAELAELTADLPAAPAPAPPARRDTHLRARLASWISLNGACTAIWAVSGAHGSFWPVWVMLGTGLGLFSSLVNRAFGVEHTHSHDRDYRRERHRQRHRHGPLPPPRLPGIPPPPGSRTYEDDD